MFWNKKPPGFGDRFRSLTQEPTEEEKRWLARQDPDFHKHWLKRLEAIRVFSISLLVCFFIFFLLNNYMAKVEYETLTPGTRVVNFYEIKAGGCGITLQVKLADDWTITDNIVETREVCKSLESGGSYKDVRYRISKTTPKWIGRTAVTYKRIPR